MRTAFVALCILLAISITTQSNAQTSPVKFANTIENCSTISTDGFISTQVYPGALEYEFELKNITTGNSLTLVSASNSIQLNAFASIITYSSSYHTKVRIKYSGSSKDSYTDWTNMCEFALGLPPKEIALKEGICGSVITDLDLRISAVPIYNATCYTFYITNLTNGQTYVSPCTTNNFIYLSAVGITLLPGDEIAMSVTYTLNGEESEPSKPCEMRLDHQRKFCEVIQETFDPVSELKKMQNAGNKTVSINVGTKFVLTYFDGSAYATPVWAANSADVINTAVELLEDIDAFLNRNFVDASCGNVNQRMGVSLSAYPQSWVDLNWYTNALGVASQNVQPDDINLLSQGCSQIPMVQLATTYFPYGDYMTIPIGAIYLNPAVSNFNMNYPGLPTGGEYDLYSVLLHELTHILGINSSDFKFRDMLYAGATPLNAPGIFDCDPDPNFNTLAISGCTNISCIGNYTNDPVYAPPVFDQGSSLSHFPDVCSGSPLGNNVMNPGISMGQVKRFYHQREVNALQDLGFNFTNPFNGVNYTLNNSNYIVGNHDGLLVQTYPDEGFLCDGVTYAPIVHTICDSWPLNLAPLVNDMNATFIQEAVVKTGNANASVTITGANNDQLNFTATQPGVYTIGYLPASTDREGLPTYIQVYVPACGESDLDDLTCNDTPECNQICFGNVYEHILLSGNQFIFPAIYSDNSFKFSCNYQETDQGSTQESCYSSLFFWVNTNPGENYSLSFRRSYSETGATSLGNPHVKSYAYLVKSSDMINGQVNQSSNNFVLPANKQLVYEELFTADNYPIETSSFCFAANDDYDMLVFYNEQINNFSYIRRGDVLVRDLEFMKKEVPVLPTELSGCVPQTLSLGQNLCAVSTNTFSWISQNSNTVLSSNQVYSPGAVTTALDDNYIFNISYPALPSTVITPSQNSSCNFSDTVDITFIECCSAGPTFTHPMTCNSAGRTFGADVDGDNSGAVYYSGAMDPDITFGSQTVSCITLNALEGFLVKFDDFCLSWLVRTDFLYSKLEVSDAGRVFYLGGVDPAKFKYLAQFNAANGAVVWAWNAPPGAQITDFVLDEAASQIIVTGRMTGSGFNYMGTTIPGTADDIFVLRISYSGAYVAHSVIPVISSVSESRVALKNNNLFVSFATSTTLWRLVKLDYTTLALLASPAPVPISSPGGNFVFNTLEVEGTNSHVMAQFVYDNPVSYNGSMLLNASGVKRTGYIRIDPNTLGALSAIYLADIGFVQGYMFGSDMDVSNGKAVFTYRNTLNEVHVKAVNTATDATLWDKMTVGIGASDWAAAKGVKFAPSGVYNTGCFWQNILIDNTNPLSTINPNTTSFYGIKYQENSGTITALSVNDEITEYQNNAELEILGLDDLTDGNWVSLFPNPGKGLFTVKAEGNYRITIRDIHGKVVDQYEGIDQSKFDISERSNGIYLVEVTGERGTQIFKLIKE